MLYTALARWYDIIYRDYLERVVPKIIDFVVEVFEKVAERDVEDVLDIACGTGGPTLLLAKRGYRVTGLDLHEEMLEVARSKALNEGLNIEFPQGDARNLEFSEEFDAATMFFTSIAYMTEWEDLMSLLRSVHAALRPGGVFIADTSNPYSYCWTKDLNKPTVWDVKEGDNTLVMTDWKELAGPDGQVMFRRIVDIVGPDGSVRRFIMSDKLRFYTRKELELAARDAGFRKSSVVVGYSLEGKESKEPGKRLVLIAVK